MSQSIEQKADGVCRFNNGEKVFTVILELSIRAEVDDNRERNNFDCFKEKFTSQTDGVEKKYSFFVMVIIKEKIHFVNKFELKQWIKI